MKPNNEPMTMADLELILEKAAAISNHRRFVIAGSLSALGAVLVPPIDMVMSRDLDMYPQLDPGRGFIEIAAQIGEGSPFHKAHGFYADPITPQLLSLPQGWDIRLAQIPTRGGIVAMFLDPNDVAIGKLVRGHENDLRWVRAGMEQSILSIDTILARAKTVSSLSSDDRASFLRSIALCTVDDFLDMPIPDNCIDK